MDNAPRTRQESKKNQKQKGRPEKLGSSKHVRAYEALLARQGVAQKPKQKS